MNEDASSRNSLSLDAKRRIDRVCLEFETVWKSGQRPQIERYVSTIPTEERTGLFRELLLLDLEYRDGAGEQLVSDEYHNRFPEHTKLIADVFRSPSEFRGAATPGTRIHYIGDYELLEEVARGGMGIVYRARQLSLNRIVALKLVLAGQFASEEEVERFHREAEAAASLQHPNIVAIYEVGQHDSQQYFSMAFVEGRSLAGMTTKNPLSAVQAAQYVETVARAVEYAHQQGTLHRDLKPANILIDRDDQPQITDFGLARRVDADSDLTKSGQIVGSPSYMPPEQASGRLGEVGPCSDVYALGAVLYDLVTGRPPFKAETPTETLLHVLHNEPVPLRALNPKVPRDLETICLKCLEKEPHRRYRSAAELCEELKRFLAGEPIHARPITPPGRVWRWCRRNPAVAALAAGLIAAVSVGFIGIVSQWIRAENIAQNESIQRRKAEEARYFADMIVAQGAWESGNVDRVVELLERHQPRQDRENLRGFQWRYLRRLCQRSMNTPTLPHGGSVWGIAFSPDGKTLASVGYDKPVRLWDVETGQPRKQLGVPGYVISVAFSPDGRTLASGACFGDLMLWDLTTVDTTSGRPLVGARHIYSIAFSPDGAVLASAGHGDTVQLWELATGKQLRTLKKHKSGPVWFLAFSPDGKTLASATEWEVILWDVETDTEPHVLRGDVASGPRCAFTADGKTLGVGGLDGKIWLWDVESGQLIKTLQGQTRGHIWCLAFSSDGRLAVGSNDGTVTLWDAECRAEQDVLKGHQHLVWAVAFSPDNSVLASASWDGRVRLWDVTARRPTDLLSGHTSEVTAVAFSPDGSTVASGSYDGTVKIWDLHTAEELTTLPAREARITSIAFSPDARILASAYWGDDVRLWDLAAGQRSTSLNRGLTSSVAFSADGTTLSAGGGGPRADVWDVVTGKRRCSTTSGYSSLNNGHRNNVAAVAICPGGEILATGSWDKKIMLWDLATGTWLKTLENHRGQVLCLTFSTDGKTVASGSADTSVKLWDVDTGKVRETLEGHAGAVNSVVFSPDGRMAASGASDRTVKLWYLDTAKQPETLPHDAPVTSVMFSPDGNTLASASGNTVRLWRTDGEDIAAEHEALVSLERRARTIVEADAQVRQQIVNDMVACLATSVVEGLLQRDIILAASIAQRLQDMYDRELAAEAFHSFAEALAESQDMKFRRVADEWQGTAR